MTFLIIINKKKKYLKSDDLIMLGTFGRWDLEHNLNQKINDV